MVYKATVLALICLIYNVVEAEVTQRQAPECSLPRRTGNCVSNFRRYYYDSTSGECKLFFYTGCGGNINNFKTLDECYGRCVCSQNVLPGNGTQSKQRFYYDVNIQRCKSFKYTGEGGNQNRFVKRSQCMAKCESYPVRENCDARPDLGYTCENKRSKQFYFDVNCNCCRSFRYLGCGGNNNRFPTNSDCMNTCKIEKIPRPEDLQPVKCSLQAEYGNCTEQLVRYYFSTVADKCIPFVYSGCGGNQNNFDTLDKCNFECDLSATNTSASLRQNDETNAAASTNIVIADTPVVKGGNIKNIAGARTGDLDSLLQLAKDSALVG
ncbi:hypothetical protein ACF0H5_001350 [Mactra antiquata]